MLHIDTNNFIKLLYKKSIDEHVLKLMFGGIDEEFFENDEDQYKEYLIEEQQYPILRDMFDKIQYMFDREARCHCIAFYKYMKGYTASDVYLFADPSQIITSKFLPANINFFEYPRKKELSEIINKIMLFQESQGQIDYHPNYNDLSQEMKDKIDNILKDRQYFRFRSNRQKKQKKKDSLQRNSRIRTILHQSLQSYHSSYSNISQEEIIKIIWERKSKIRIDTWGKRYSSSESQFLWLPAKFVYSSEEKRYQLQGKLFHPLEECELIPELKVEVAELLTYFAPALNTTHEYYSKLNYLIVDNNSNQKLLDFPGQKLNPSFNEKIHAIVNITEITIEPHSTYMGKWHAQGYSSDNILYTCLYVIQQDEQLTGGKIKFKRHSRVDDEPPMKDIFMIKDSHKCPPNFEALCDTHKLIPLGSLDSKENLMIVFPNQNIQRVKGFKNETDQPLKRKIITFLVVNHEAQPLTVNDVNYTQPISFIKEQRFMDMYERLKNKSGTFQSYSFCEH